MNLDRKIVKEIPYPFDRMNWDLVDRWADGIPVFSENDPFHPEWRATPVMPLDFGDHVVSIKNEADLKSNPNGTVKDRLAWEVTAIARDYARALWLKRRSLDGKIQDLPVPRITLLTAGNAGTSLAYFFDKYGLPPPKLLLDDSIPDRQLKFLKGLYADIYLADLEKKELSDLEINQLTNNRDGINLTSLSSIQPELTFYDWHVVNEALNEDADVIYVPYGSGRLMENYLAWQERLFRQHISGIKDLRLQAPITHVISTDILGAQPVSPDSKADKLACHYNPFKILEDHDISALVSLAWTGRNTGIYKVRESYLEEAYRKMKNAGIETSHSGASGLALHLQLFDEGRIDLRKKHLVINTGKGI